MTNTYPEDAPIKVKTFEEMRCIRCVLERILRVMDEGLFVDYQMEKFGKDYKTNINEPDEEKCKAILEKMEIEINFMVERCHFEDGFIHSSEKIINEHYLKYPKTIIAWIESTFIHPTSNIILCEAILRAIEHFEALNINKHSELQIVCTDALSHKNIEIQENVLSIFEDWKDPKAVKILKKIEISTPYLAEYRDKIISQMEK